MKPESPQLHEEAYRGSETMARLSAARVTICGAGAVGSCLTEALARQGFRKLRVVDMDRVDPRNLSTQVYQKADIGALKASALKNAIFRSVGVEIEARSEKLTDRNIKQLLKESDVVVDGFDNSASRQLVSDFVRSGKLPCLHIGLAGDYAEVIWDPIYRVPAPAGEDVCDYPLARNLIGLAVAVAAEVLVAFVSGGSPGSYTITLKDLSVRSYP